MTVPTLYGWFHLLSLGITAAVTILLCRTHKKGDDAHVRRVILFTAVLVMILELYKQFIHTFSYSDEIKLSYQWYIFPWQFCSTPMYAGLIAGLTKKGRIHNAACAYLATYALFAGLCVMFYPGDVYTYQIGINIQTMVCHGSMVAIAIYLLYSGYVKVDKKTFLSASAVFAVAVGIAVILNEIAHLTGITENHNFNMFFVSPHRPPSLPVYSIVQQYVPYPFCLFIYIIGFSLAVALIMLAAKGITHLANKRKKATV